MKVKFENIICRVEGKVNAQTTDIPNYLGKGHGECGEIAITQHGDLLKDRATLGMAFRFSFKKGDVLFMSRSFSNRKAGMAMFDGICSEKTFVLRTKDGNILLQKYLPLIIQNDEFWEYCEENKAGGVNNFINWKTIANYELDIPSIEEQKIIANKTWAAYRLKEGYKKLLAATDEMVKSQFIEMFGTLDEPKVNVSKLIDVVVSSGQYGSNTSATDYQEGKPRYIRITDINDDGSLNDDIKTAEVIDDKYRLESGDIVFARTGATVGKTYLHEAGDAIYAGYLIKYQMDSELMKPLFMKAFTHSKTYYNWVANSQKVGAQPNISATQYDQMPILVPSVDEQEAFLKIYQQADKSKFADFKSQFIEMFGTSCDSVKTILSDFVSLKAGKNKKSELIKDVFTDGLYPCYGGNGIRGYVEDYTHSGIYCIIGRQGAQCGNVQIAEGEFYATEHAVVVTPLTDVNSIWLFHALTQMNLNQYARGAAQPGLAVNQLEILPFSLPSIASQTQFALIAEQADKSKSHVLKALKETEILLQHSIRQVV